MLGPITKYVKLITDCNEIKYELEKSALFNEINTNGFVGYTR